MNSITSPGAAVRAATGRQEGSGAVGWGGSQSCAQSGLWRGLAGCWSHEALVPRGGRQVEVMGGSPVGTCGQQCSVPAPCKQPTPTLQPPNPYFAALHRSQLCMHGVIRAVWQEDRMCGASVIQSVVLAGNMFTTFPLL